MSRSYRYLHYDVFTDHVFGGNQLAVVLDGRGLSTETMQAIAKEMNFSETTFVLPPEQDGTDVRMRILTPGQELPMAGHPTIGSTFAFAEPMGDRAMAAAALSVPAGAIAGTGLPVQIVSAGVPFLFVPLTTRSAVDNASVNRGALDDLLTAAGGAAHGVFLFSAERAADRATVYSRMFAREIGVAEDPATGVASGPLGCYLVRHKVVPPERAGAMLSLQGVKMGRPSDVHISVELEMGEFSRVQVGGESVLAGEGTLYI